eukprot:TRINITY_DN1556_c0_g1_i2.p3 TRINITY_DN1556_c0_g1~~TRINITY_DN1556_c0_g1_i2.p3  ORF type:complete len:271 (-),score=5.13 TRINITY_DN1556_c0_g1_i2:1618-2430(-)
MFECASHHVWKVKYSKQQALQGIRNSLFSKWCSHCTKMKKVEAKRQKQEELRRQKERFVEEQNEMLEKARREMFKQSSDHIGMTACQMAMNYLSTQPNDGLGICYEDAVLLYNILLTPAELLLGQMYQRKVEMKIEWPCRSPNQRPFIGKMLQGSIRTNASIRKQLRRSRNSRNAIRRQALTNGINNCDNEVQSHLLINSCTFNTHTINSSVSYFFLRFWDTAPASICDKMPSTSLRYFDFSITFLDILEFESTLAAQNCSITNQVNKLL